MLEEGFLRRWARRKTEVREGRAVESPSEPASAPAPAADAPDIATVDAPLQVRSPETVAPAGAPEPAPAPPTMEDVAALDADSDFSAFVARGVDQAVRRGALKKLFADPHFKVMDKLDVYIDDYTQASPVSAAMLASLSHAKSVFMRVAGDEEGGAPEPAPAQAEADAEAEAEAEAERAAPLQQPPEQETQ